MKNQIEKIKKFIVKENEKIFILGLIIYIVSVIISDYTIIGNNISDNIVSLIKYFGVFLAIIKIVFVDMSKYSEKEKVRLLILFGLVLIISIVSKNRTILQYFFLIVGAKDVSFKKIATAVLIAESIILITMSFLSSTGIVENRVITRTSETIKRYSLGFKDCKYPAIMIWSITLIILYLRNKNITLIELILMVLTNIVIYKLTDSRNELLCSLISIVAVPILLKINNKKLNKVIYYGTKYSISILFIVFFILTLLYGAKINLIYGINKGLSGRLYLTHKALNEYGVPLFGKHIKWLGLNSMYSGLITKAEMNFVDCSYMKIMFEYGIVGIGLLIFGYLKLFNIEEVKNDNILILVLLNINLHSFLDPQFLALPFNIFLIMLCYVIFSKKEEKVMKQADQVNGELLSLNEIHKEEIKMMQKFIQYCEKNNLTYYICGGTLLGAIRHKGFIPWDDDIDILMPRPDFMRFEKLVKEDNLLIAKDLEVHSFNLGNLNDPFCKIMNLNTIMDKHYVDDEYDKHLWLDVFPMDGLPESKEETEKIYKKILFLRRVVVMLKAKDEIVKNESKTKLKAIIKPVLRTLLKPIGIKRIVNKINKICMKYDYETSKYVGGIAWGYGPQEKLLREEVKNKKIVFENIEVNTFACYDEYLKNLYGNYMELPPKDKQIAHIMKVRKIKDGE